MVLLHQIGRRDFYSPLSSLLMSFPFFSLDSACRLFLLLRCLRHSYSGHCSLSSHKLPSLPSQARSGFELLPGSLAAAQNLCLVSRNHATWPVHPDKIVRRGPESKFAKEGLVKNGGSGPPGPPPPPPPPAPVVKKQLAELLNITHK